LASAVFDAPVERVVGLRAPWDRLPAAWVADPLSRLDPARDRLSPPWPDVLIGCGRGVAAVSMGVRRASDGRTFTAQIQDPLTPPDRFDLVIAMGHDAIDGPNVVKVTTALHDVTAAALADAAERWRDRMPGGAGPLAGVLLGGPTRGGGFAAGGALVDALKGLRASGTRVYVLPSRRTPAPLVAALRQAFADDAGAEVWDRSGENPYRGVLALADRLIVTSDSVSMISEALATPHPVEVMGAAQNARHRRFLKTLIDAGQLASFVGGSAPARAGRPVSGTAEAAQALRAALAARTGRSA
jgi:mitochondrial fission protein ELM1